MKYKVLEYIQEVSVHARIQKHLFEEGIAQRAGIDGLRGATGSIQRWLLRFNANGYIKLVASAAEYELKPWDSGFLLEFDTHFQSLPRAQD